jgi:hypothetical protein
MMLSKTNIALSAKPVCVRRNKSHIVYCNKDVKFNEIVERRKELDKQRVERIKEIGSTIDHIAKSEVKHTGEILHEVLPFLKDVDFKNWKKEDVEKWVKDVDVQIKKKLGITEPIVEKDVIDVDMDDE